MASGVRIQELGVGSQNSGVRSRNSESSQMRRAGRLIPANIAEGFKKRGRAGKVRILNIAQGSLEESRYYLILSRDLDYADITSLHQQLEEVSKLLEGYLRAIERSKS